MNRTVSTLRWIAVGVVALIAAVVLMTWAQVGFTRGRAFSLLKTVDKLTVGKTTFFEAQREVEPFLADNVVHEKNGAGEDYQSFIFDNMRLSELRLSTYRRFTVRFLFRDGILIEKRAQAFVDDDCTVTMTERIRDYPEVPSHFSTIPSGYDQPVNVARIDDTDAYDEHLRAADWDFDLGYLTSAWRCRDARKILPPIGR
jgi:hypothetical protein